MGKVRKLKLNLSKNYATPSATSTESKPNKIPIESKLSNKTHIADPEEDPFLALKLNLDDLIQTDEKSQSEDTKGTMTFKSLKSKISGNRVMKRKEKLNLKRKLLMKKIDVIEQMKKELKVRNKRKQTAIMGDTNPLRDALPSLESLLKTRPNIKNTPAAKTKKAKSTEKAKDRKRKF
ncbi:uncharacterized protein [Leptinotarsa decemlineata]|uniref:uncharacterized protein n=1 Tax=Leptinotarsa decemlineata TaxID=7539 RepID=UPI003D30A7CB